MPNRQEPSIADTQAQQIFTNQVTPQTRRGSHQNGLKVISFCSPTAGIQTSEGEYIIQLPYININSKVNSLNQRAEGYLGVGGVSDTGFGESDPSQEHNETEWDEFLRNSEFSDMKTCNVQFVAPETKRIEFYFFESNFACRSHNITNIVYSGMFDEGYHFPANITKAMSEGFQPLCGFQQPQIIDFANPESSNIGSYTSLDNFATFLLFVRPEEIAYIRFRVRFVENESPCNVYGWSLNGTLDMVLPSEEKECMFFHQSPIHFQILSMSVPGPSNLVQSVFPTTQASRNLSSPLSARSPFKRLFSQPIDISNFDIPIFLKNAKKYYRNFRYVSLSNILNWKNWSLNRLQRMCDKNQPEVALEIIEDTVSGAALKHRLCGSQKMLPQHVTELRFRTSCVNDMSVIKLVRRNTRRPKLPQDPKIQTTAAASIRNQMSAQELLQQTTEIPESERATASVTLHFRVTEQAERARNCPNVNEVVPVDQRQAPGEQRTGNPDLNQEQYEDAYQNMEEFNFP